MVSLLPRVRVGGYEWVQSVNTVQVVPRSSTTVGLPATVAAGAFKSSGGKYCKQKIVESAQWDQGYEGGVSASH